MFKSSESYVGKYLTTFAFTINEFDKDKQDINKIPLKRILIGDRNTDPMIQLLVIRRKSIDLGYFKFNTFLEPATVKRR